MSSYFEHNLKRPPQVDMIDPPPGLHTPPEPIEVIEADDTVSRRLFWESWKEAGGTCHEGC